MAAAAPLRVHFPDGSFRTVSVSAETSADELAKSIFDSSKAKLPGNEAEYSLFEQTADTMRQLAPNESPVLVRGSWTGEAAEMNRLVLRPIEIRPPCVKEGYLTKRGHFVKNWKRRWYRMANGLMMYFRSHKDTTPAGCIPLKGASVQPAPLKLKKKFSFEIVCKDGSTHYAFAGSEQEMQAWMDAIKEWIHYYYLLAFKTSLTDDISASTATTVTTSTKAVITDGVCLDDFELLRVLGKGSFGKVTLARKKDSGELFAIKILKKEEILANEELEHTRAEREVLMSVQHPFLVGMHYSFQTADRLYMVMDYVNGGELFFLLQQNGKLDEERARFYAAEIICGIGELHKQGIIYRDLKLENLLLNQEGHIMVTDFGLCKRGLSYGATTNTFCGTPEYLAPEVVEDEDYTVAVDWWSVGIVLYEMMTGRSPFAANDHQELFRQILSSDIYYPSSLSENAKDLLERLLDRNPRTRLGSGPSDAEELKTHPFFDGIDFDALEALEIEPPYKPALSGDTDTSHFDPLFTSMTPMLTPADTSAISETEQQNFAGFTYVPSNLGG